MWVEHRLHLGYLETPVTHSTWPWALQELPRCLPFPILQADILTEARQAALGEINPLQVAKTVLYPAHMPSVCTGAYVREAAVHALILGDFGGGVTVSAKW